jgi:hypothetical protein
LGVQAGLTSVVNEVVVLVMVRGAGSTSARGLRWPARRRGRGRRRRIRASTVFRLAGKTYVCTPVTASSSPSSHRERWGWRRAGLRQGESSEGERVSGGGGGENAGVVDLSGEKPNMNDARNCV